jgi:putative tryptophan/tyrosine transport system substrate-binding protein
MNRREVIAALTLPFLTGTVRAQQSETPIVGVLRLDDERNFVEWLRQGLRDNGFTDGFNVRVVSRFADADPARLPQLARDLAALGSRVIVATGTTAVAAVHSAAPTIPLVMAGSADPVAMGFAQSLARPGGRITGISILGAEMIGKHIELLKELVPAARAFAALLQNANPGNPRFREAFAAAGRSLAVEIQIREIAIADELADAFAWAQRPPMDGVYVIQDPIFLKSRLTLAKLAEAARLPLVAGNAEYVRAGALAAYGLDQPALWRQSGRHVAQILGGADPANMPIEQPTKFELVINRKTAAALGLEIPPSLLARADEVIE